MFSVISAGLIAVLITAVFLPAFFYNTMKERLIEDLMGGSKFNYVRVILSNNMFMNGINAEYIKNNPFIQQSVKAYCEGEKEKKEEIEKYFSNYRDKRDYPVNVGADLGGNPDDTPLALYESGHYEGVALILEGEEEFRSQNFEEEEKITNTDWYQTYQRGGTETAYFFRTWKDHNILLYLSKGEIAGKKCDVVLAMEAKQIISALKWLYEEVGGARLYFLNTGEKLYEIGQEMEQDGISLAGQMEREGQTRIAAEEKGGYQIAFRVGYQETDEEMMIAFFVSREWILQPYEYVFGFCRIVLLCTYGVLMILMIPMSVRNSEGIRKLHRGMEKVKEGTYDVSVQIHSGDEVEQLGNTFNEMALKIQEHTRERVEHEKREQAMKYQILMSQLDPHFIYNTLNTITYLAAEKKTEEIKKVNRALIAILRSKLGSDKFSSFHGVEKEMEIVRKYMELQTYFYEESLQFSEWVDEAAKDEQIPQNVIQLLVENALKHGFLPERNEQGEFLPRRICVRVEKVLNGIQITVADNGKGMSQEEVERFFDGKIDTESGRQGHIGIQNIRRRLFYLYREKAVFTAKSREGEGVEIHIYLPEKNTV